MGQIILRLDRVMADRKMSLNELAEKVGVSNVNLSKMKNGKISAIRFSTLVAICEALDCQFSWRTECLILIPSKFFPGYAVDQQLQWLMS